MAYTFEFELTSADLREAMRAGADLSWDGQVAKDMRKAFSRTLAWGVLLWPTSVIGGLWLIGAIFRPMHPGFVLGMGGVVLVATLVQYGRPLVSRKRMHAVLEAHCDQHVAGSALPGTIGPVTITINEAGLVYDAIGTSVWVSWAGLTDVREAGRFMLITSQLGRMFILPTKVIASTAAPSEVLAFAKRCQQASGGAATLIDQFMSSNRIACPVCQYSIGPGTVHRCPECGRDLEMGDLAGAQAATGDSASTRSA